MTFWSLFGVIVLGLYAIAQLGWALRDRSAKGFGALFRLVWAALAGAGSLYLSGVLS